MDTRQRNNVQNDQKEKQMHEVDFVKRISQWKKARHDIDSTTNMPVSTINCIQGERERKGTTTFKSFHQIICLISKKKRFFITPGDDIC